MPLRTIQKYVAGFLVHFAPFRVVVDDDVVDVVLD